MRRVVVTGMGIVSSIGNNVEEVTESLRQARSGISFAEEYKELGFRSHVHGKPTLDPAEVLDRRAMRFHGGGTAWNHVAMNEAIADAGLEAGDISNERTGIVMGSGGASTQTIVAAADITREKGPKRVGPTAVPKAMSSTASATLATWFKIKGVNYSISSACSTSSHCIGNAAEQIQMGKQDVMFAGGCEDLHWTLSVLFDAMGALSSDFNDRPEVASRAYDKDRDGFVIAGGAGVLVLEEYERAKARGANIVAEIVGYGATSDGADMVAPVRRGRGALHAPGDRPSRRADRLHQPARHLHDRRRPHGGPGDPRGVRRHHPADLGDEVADRPQPGRHRRPRGHLLAPDDAARLHRQERPYRDAGRGIRRPADRHASAATASGSTVSCRTPSASAAPMRASPSSA